MQHDGCSRVVHWVDAAGNVVATAYDANSNPVVVTTAEVAVGAAVASEVFTPRYVYDPFNRLVYVGDNAGQTARYPYDSGDNLVPSSEGVSDPLNLVPGTINGEGNTVGYVYDGLRRRIAETHDLRFRGFGSGALDTSNPDRPTRRIHPMRASRRGAPRFYECSPPFVVVVRAACNPSRSSA